MKYLTNITCVVQCHVVGKSMSKGYEKYFMYDDFLYKMPVTGAIIASHLSIKFGNYIESLDNNVADIRYVFGRAAVRYNYMGSSAYDIEISLLEKVKSVIWPSFEYSSCVNSGISVHTVEDYKKVFDFVNQNNKFIEALSDERL